ncbi:unnamed protein product [Adineta ricciae]|uniref:Cytochrome P450 n=1 Tax=Adineta ricciae TaxID=249248 RepID=A0A814HD53_ADIRI|nr:unnamed protein product [Adineta ricciae]CAF1160166.1 unnamed protein product [Adineta ricciae]
MYLTIIVVACFISLLVIYLSILKSRYSYFQCRGIPGPSPTFFLGHFGIIWSTKSYSRQLQSWTKQFGSIYGIFEGTRPFYVVSDVDFLQNIFIHQFSSFNSHRISFLYKLSKSVHLIGADSARWHQQRHAINPAFSAAKLKLMDPLIDRCIESFIEKSSEINQESNEFDIYKLYQRLTMDVICHCAFGIDTDMQNDVDNEMMAKAAVIFKQDVERMSLTKLSYLMPWLTPILTRFLLFQTVLFHTLHRLAPTIFPDLTDKIPRFWLLARVQQVIDARNTESGADTAKRIDLLQLMLDAKTTSQHEETTREKGLTNDEIKANIFLFMVAGFDTTSTMLANCTYVLAIKPAIQEKLYEEIHSLEKDKFDYDTITKLEYMELFLREVLRMYPASTSVLTRVCNETTTVCGHLIEKGSVIQTDLFTIHYNPDLWGPDDPHEFVPERHLTKRHPMALLTFGAGPRICIGMRFAMMEIKMTLARLLHDYKILPGKHLEEGFQLRDGFVIQPDAVYIKLQKRN